MKAAIIIFLMMFVTGCGGTLQYSTVRIAPDADRFHCERNAVRGLKCQRYLFYKI